MDGPPWKQNSYLYGKEHLTLLPMRAKVRFYEDYCPIRLGFNKKKFRIYERVPLAVHKYRTTLLMRLPGFKTAKETCFWDLRVVYGEWMSFRGRRLAYILKFESAEIAQEFLIQCMKGFEIPDVIHTSIRRFFVATLTNSGEEDSLKRLVLDLYNNRNESNEEYFLDKLGTYRLSDIIKCNPTKNLASLESAKDRRQIRVAFNKVVRCRNIAVKPYPMDYIPANHIKEEILEDGDEMHARNGDHHGLVSDSDASVVHEKEYITDETRALKEDDHAITSNMDGEANGSDLTQRNVELEFKGIFREDHDQSLKFVANTKGSNEVHIYSFEDALDLDSKSLARYLAGKIKFISECSVV